MMWGGPPGPQPTPSSACSRVISSGSWGTRADQGVRPTIGGKLLLSDDVIQAQRARAGCHQVQKDEAVQHRQLATVRDWPESMRKMSSEVSHGHFSAKQERHRPREQAQQNQQSAETLQSSRQPHLGKEVRAGSMPHASEEPEQFLETVQRKSKTGYDARER